MFIKGAFNYYIFSKLFDDQYIYDHFIFFLLLQFEKYNEI